SGAAWFGAHGIDLSALKNRPLTRPCLDWSERRHHLAGALGVALTQRLLELQWLVRGRQSRAVRVTQDGQAALQAELGLGLERWRVVAPSAGSDAPRAA